MNFGDWFNGKESSKYSPVPGTIPGTGITLRGIALTITPLCLDDFVSIEPELKSYDTQSISKQLALTARWAHRSLLANHPDITLEDVRRLIDTNNMRKVMEALVSTNELELTKPGESRPASP